MADAAPPIVPAAPPVTTTTAAPPATPPVQPGKWFEGKADAITVGWLQNKGFNDKPSEDVALAAIKMHMEAEKFVGAPADQLIRLPKDRADAKAWDEVFHKLGALKDGEKPDFTNIKTPDGKEIPKEIQDLATMVGYRTRMTKEAAIFAAQEIAKYLNADVAKFGEELTGKLAAAKDALAKNWGNDFNGNTIVAENAMRSLGVTKEQQAAAEKAIGYDKMMEMFRTIGVKMGEDKFVSNAGSNSGLPALKTREQVTQRINELKNDKAWAERYVNGGTGSVEHKEMSTLLKLLTAPAS